MQSEGKDRSAQAKPPIIEWQVYEDKPDLQLRKGRDFDEPGVVTRSHPGRRR
jgi:hypothetical protein